ncbi:MAG: transcriptional repressor [Syntrophorhabdales bacterium]|jgi:Fur family peroxide stress response transcriptional regulator
MMKDKTTETLREIGLKITPQRRAILRLLDGNRTHPSAHSIYLELLKEYPGISFATVYNTLSMLAKAGKIQELDIDPGKKRFDPCITPHYHFYCKACGKVLDIACGIPFLANMGPLDTRTVDGHRVDAIQLNFKGVCKDCAQGDEASTHGAKEGNQAFLMTKQKKT